MNRKTFLAALGAVLVAPFLPKMNASSSKKVGMVGATAEDFAAIDSKFATSSKDLADAISRIGATAESAGVNLNELTAYVTAIQEKTARGGVVIGNGLKTIFTNLEKMQYSPWPSRNWVIMGGKTPLHALECAAERWRDLATSPDCDTLRQQLCRDIGGTYHSNLVAAILSDLNSPKSVYYVTLNKLFS